MSSQPRWRKSSRSSDQGGACIEVAHLTAEQWRKSSRSDDQGGACVEVAHLTAEQRPSRLIGVRDSKAPHGPVLGFTHPEWADFVTAVKNGTFTR
jgi:hypothetical protein